MKRMQSEALGLYSLKCSANVEGNLDVFKAEENSKLWGVNMRVRLDLNCRREQQVQVELTFCKTSL